MESLDKLQAGQKDGPLYVKTYVHVIVTGDISSPKNHFCAALTIFILLTSTGSSTERTVAFP
jgi:hypothetical protein